MNGNAILSLKDVHKWFNRGTAKEIHVIRGVRIDVFPGEVLVLIGPSGSGKSTLLRCMNFLTPPDSGQMQFKNELWLPPGRRPFNPLTRLRHEKRLVSLRSNIGMVF